jgi:hypothetical protein
MPLSELPTLKALLNTLSGRHRVTKRPKKPA